MDSSVEAICSALIGLIEKERQLVFDEEPIFRERLLKAVTEGRPTACETSSYTNYLTRLPRLEGGPCDYVAITPGAIKYTRGDVVVWSAKIFAEPRNVHPQGNGSVIIATGTSTASISEDGSISLWSRGPRHPYSRRILNEQLGVSCGADGSKCAAFSLEGSDLIVRLRRESREQAAALQQASAERLERFETALAFLRLD